MNGNVHGGAICLLPGDLVDVNDVLLAVDMDHTTGIALVMTASHHNFIVLANRNGTNAVLLSQILVQRR